MIIRTLIVFISFIISICLFELFLRVSPFGYGTSSVEYDPEIGYWHKKLSSNYSKKDCYNTLNIFDSRGLPEFRNKYDKDKKSIVFLGDSYIEGLSIQNKNLIHNKLDIMLDSKFNIMNYALGGTTVIQHYVILKNKIFEDFKDYKISNVFQFLNLPNDLLESKIATESILSRPKVYIEFKKNKIYGIVSPRIATSIDKLMDLASNFETYFFLKKVIYFFKNKITENEDNSINIITKQNIELFINSILITKELLLQNKINYTIFFNIEKNEYNNKILKNVKIALKKNDISFVMLNDVLSIDKSYFHDCDHHFNSKAHNEIAKIILKLKLVDKEQK